MEAVDSDGSNEIVDNDDNNGVQLINSCDKSANNLMNSIGNDRNSVLQMDDGATSMTSTMLFEQSSEVNDHQSSGRNSFPPPSDNESEMSTSLIYRVRNAGATGIGQMSVSAIIEHLKNGNSAKPNYNHITLVMDSVQRITDFVSRKVFGAIVDLSGGAFTASDTKPVEHEMGNAKRAAVVLFTEQQLTVLSSSECKKLLMQLFEITLGVLICEHKEKKAGKNAFQLILYFSNVNTLDAKHTTQFPQWENKHTLDVETVCR